MTPANPVASTASRTTRPTRARLTAACPRDGVGQRIARPTGRPTRKPSRTSKYGKSGDPAPGDSRAPSAKPRSKLAAIVAAAPAREIGLLAPASFRASHVTPTMYNPTTAAKWYSHVQAKPPATHRPSRTLRERHAPIANGPAQVRFNQASYSRIIATNKLATTTGD